MNLLRNLPWKQDLESPGRLAGCKMESTWYGKRHNREIGPARIQEFMPDRNQESESQERSEIHSRQRPFG